VSGRAELAEVCARLNEQGARYVVVGGAAVRLWGAAQASPDIELLIGATAENAGRVLKALLPLADRLGLALDVPADAVASRSVTLVGDRPRLALLTIANKLRHPEAARDAADFAVDGVKVPAASIAHLIASKQTGRLLDAADVEALLDLRRAGRA
jgi:hypothetical protein